MTPDAGLQPLTAFVAPLPVASRPVSAASPSVLGSSPVSKPPSRTSVSSRPPAQTPMCMAQSRPIRKRPIASRIANAAIKLLIHSLCTNAEGVDVDIDASSNLALLSGRLNAVTVKVSSLVYNGLSISGGAALYTDEIHLTSVDTTTFAAPPRLAKPFSVSVRATLTEADLNRPGPLRDAIQTLLRQIVSVALSGALGRTIPDAIGGVTCTLQSVALRDHHTVPPTLFAFWPFGRKQRPTPQDGCLELGATASLASGRVINFAVRTGVEVIDGGNLIKLKDPILLWNGLDIPMLTIDMIGVRLDSATRVTNVFIRHGRLSADAITIIAPPPSRSRQLPETAQW